MKWKPYGKGIDINDHYYLIVNFFTPRTDRCVVCGKPAVAMMDGQKVCSIECGKELTFSEWEKFIDGI